MGKKEKAPVLDCSTEMFLFPSWPQLWFNKQEVSQHASACLCQEIKINMKFSFGKKKKKGKRLCNGYFG